MNFSFRIFFGVRGLKGLKEIGNLLYKSLIYNPSLKKKRKKEKNQWYSFFNYRTHYTILRISRSIKYNSIVKLSKLILPLLYFSISLRAGAKLFCCYRPCYGKIICYPSWISGKILRCYHSNGFLWQNVCIVIFISLDFTKRNLTLFCEFFLSNFFWSERP